MRSLAVVARTLAAALLVATTAACPDDPSGPDAATMASRFEALVREHRPGGHELVYLWSVAAVALRSGAEVAELTVETDGRTRTFRGVVIQYEIFPSPSVGERRRQTYLVAWGDPSGHEIFSYWTAQDSVDFGSSQAPPFSIGSASLHTSGTDSLWLYHTGWAKLAPQATGESCQSWQRPSDECRVVTVAAAASLEMRAVPIGDGGFGTPSPTPHRLVVRPAQLRGVHITQLCFGTICSISFPY